jgi:hypothetical protein
LNRLAADPKVQILAVDLDLLARGRQLGGNRLDNVQ